MNICRSFLKHHKVCAHMCAIQRFKHASYKNVKDPGIHLRKKLYPDEEVTEFDDMETELEADFTTAGSSYNDHLKEMAHNKDRLIRNIMKQKYFKETYPNFLTWNDILKIRHLHHKDPEEWNFDHLSEGFPALPEIIAKICKANWVKKSQSRIKAHDESVKNNWMLFKQDKLALPPHLKNHLSKFTSRQLNFDQFDPGPNEKTLKVATKHTEYLDIIASYERLKDKETEEVSKQEPEEAVYLPGPRQSTEEMTIQEQHQEVDLNSSDKGVVTYKKLDGDLLPYPERINIPRKLYKKGYTYKVNDCYYDDDGVFLYRVPGMAR